jgi:Mre11 DNA-binding presumed domain
MEKIRLTTIRPFVMREIVLAEEPRFQKKGCDTTKEAVIKFLQEQVFPLVY